MTRPFIINKSGVTIYFCKGNSGRIVPNNTRYGSALTKGEYNDTLYIANQYNMISSKDIDCRNINSSNAKELGKIGSLMRELSTHKKSKKNPIYVINEDKTLTIKSFNSKTNEVLDQ